MPTASAKTSRPLSALLLGLAATLAIALVHVAGLDGPAELNSLDLRFRVFAAAPPSEDLVFVDIDDRSLDELGRWPWPRERLAALTDVLKTCGAATVALDIILPEPQETRLTSDAWDLQNPRRPEETDDAPPRPILDDVILAEIVEKAGNVSLPMHVDFTGKQMPLVSAVQKLLAGSAAMSFDDVRDALGSGVDAETARKAYLRARSLRALERFRIPPDRVAGHPARLASVVVPPLLLFARAMQGTGFVTVVPDSDGVVRHIPLLARVGDGVYPQFALELAARRLAAQHGGSYAFAADAGGVTIRCADGFVRRIPVEADGQMLINWAPLRGGRVLAERISAAGFAKVLALRQFDAEEELRIAHRDLAARLPMLWPGNQMLEDLYYDGAAPLEKQTNEVRQLVAKRHFELWHAMLFDPAPGKLRVLRADLAAAVAVAAKLRSQREQFHALLLRSVPKALAGAKGTAELRDDVRRILDSITDEIPGAAETARTEIARTIKELRPLVAGRICLIGSTATGAADFVPTPIHERMPGVTVHGNIVNTILSGAFITRTHRSTGILVILLAGAGVALLAAMRPVLQAGPLTLGLGAAYAAVNGFVVFGMLHVWLPLIAPLAAMAAALLVVTGYRQLTEERAKRHIRGLFAHALSPQLVDRLIAEPDLAALGGQKRELTCFFSDLAGFTPIAERLGEQKTVQLLNRYFDRMTDVIQNRCGGYLNKFLGDGLFVFFGAPVLQHDHPARAVRAAVECLAEVRRLNNKLREELDADVHLSIRIGLATGEVMVGNCGSTQRMDYTAIGDTVNLSSRLEGASKFFGTHILAAEETWRMASAEGILARPLGQVIVVGKAEPVGVWQIEGPTAGASDATQQAFGDFAGGVELYANAQFTAAAAAFESVLDAIPDDRPAQLYLDLCRTHEATPPGDDFSPAIRLTEK